MHGAKQIATVVKKDAGGDLRARTVLPTFALRDIFRNGSSHQENQTALFEIDFGDGSARVKISKPTLFLLRWFLLAGRGGSA